MNAAPSDPLAREQAHLAASRAALRAMREDVESLDIRDVTTNWVNAQVLQGQIDERIKALADLSHTPLFFGRLDFLHAPGADQAEGAEVQKGSAATSAQGRGRETGGQFYIGRRHVHDADGDPHRQHRRLDRPGRPSREQRRRHRPRRHGQRRPRRRRLPLPPPALRRRSPAPDGSPATPEHGRTSEVTPARAAQMGVGLVDTVVEQCGELEFLALGLGQRFDAGDWSDNWFHSFWVKKLKYFL